MTDQAFENILRNFLATVPEFVSSLWSKANRDLQHLRSIQHLLRMNPDLVGIQSE